MWLVDLFATGGFGTIVGLVGSYMTKREERLSKEIEIKGQKQLAELRLKEQEQEQAHELGMADKAQKRVETEGALKIGEVEAGAFVASVADANRNVGIKFVDGIRGLMRPAITLYLLIIATVLAWKLNKLVGGLNGLPVDEVYALYKSVIQQIIFLTATAVTWWFGSRPTQQPRKV